MSHLLSACRPASIGWSGRLERLPLPPPPITCLFGFARVLREQTWQGPAYFVEVIDCSKKSNWTKMVQLELLVVVWRVFRCPFLWDPIENILNHCVRLWPAIDGIRLELTWSVAIVGAMFLSVIKLIFGGIFFIFIYFYRISDDCLWVWTQESAPSSAASSFLVLVSLAGVSFLFLLRSQVWQDMFCPGLVFFFFFF